MGVDWAPFESLGLQFGSDVEDVLIDDRQDLWERHPFAAEPAKGLELWGVPQPPSKLLSEPGMAHVTSTLAHLGLVLAAARVAAVDTEHSGRGMALIRTAHQLAQELLLAARDSASHLARMTWAKTLAENLALDLLTTLEEADAAAADGEGAAVAQACALDRGYYLLLSHKIACGWPTPALPDPPTWFDAVCRASGAVDAAKALEGRFPGLSDFLAPIKELASSGDPLGRVMLSRWQEGALLLWSRGLGTRGEAMEEARMEQAVDQAGDGALLRWVGEHEHEHGPGEAGASGDEEAAAVAGHSTSPADYSTSEDGSALPVLAPKTAYPELQDYRDAARGWPCHLYAFAPVTRAAVQAIQRWAQGEEVLEIGAGVGYWARALRAEGVRVLATDLHPTPRLLYNNESIEGEVAEEPSEGVAAGPSGTGRRRFANLFHGNVPPVTKVVAADAHSLPPEMRRPCLLLCYPPPQSEAGEVAVRQSGADAVFLVGEFEGHTGTSSLTRLLFGKFDLKEVVSLPNWTDTAHYLTVWQRRQGGCSADGIRRLSSAGILSCKTCGRVGEGVASWCGGVAESGLGTARLRVCVFNHSTCFCGQPCMDSGADAFLTSMAARLVFLDRGDLEWEGPVFTTLVVGADEN